MPRRIWRKPCSARRTNGQPCRAWAVTGGKVCVTHGGAARQVRFAGKVEFVEQDYRRQFDASVEMWRNRLVKWWARRVVFLAEVTGEDSAKLAAKVADPVERRFLWALLPDGVRWPAGLRAEDEPQFELNRHVGRRSLGRRPRSIGGPK